ncbi:hypothetical protein SteCoe_17524 [Stentor coeruleus]|uniref:Uncharacterized protein n=1 Tax=Stentor coeruleus TaxID=5963 RepID=A0A1R2BYQ8_9CILI|nr:hypothetical protein SteCoe_17524 [Stentor coeruleus]
METKGQALTIRGRFRSNNSEDKHTKMKIPYLPSLKETLKTNIQSKKLLKNTSQALIKNSPTTKSQFYSPYHQKSNSFNHNLSSSAEKNQNKKFDVESSVHQVISQKSKNIIENCCETNGEMPEIHLTKDEKNVANRYDLGEESKGKVFKENHNIRAFCAEDIKDDFYDDKYRKSESPETFKNYNGELCLKKEIEELKKKIASLEEKYTKDINFLEKNIEKEKQKSSMTIIKLDEWTDKYNSLSRKYEAVLDSFVDKEKSYKIEIEELKNKLKQANEEINDKNQEIIQINEYLQNKRKGTKIKSNTLKDLSEKNKLLEAEHSLQNEELNTVKTTLKRTQTELENKKNQFATIESYIQNLNNKNINFASLEQTLSDLNKNYNFVSANYKELQIAYFNLKEKSYENEQNLLASIEKLKNSAQNNIINPINEPKFRRMNTFSSESNIENTTKDMMSRLLKKISTLEEQIRLYQNDIEKSNKDLIYTKKALEEKCEMISIMDKQINSKN